MATAPLRISFLGGGTDFPSWFEHKDGMVISTTINMSVKIIISELAPIWGTKYKFSYSEIENVHSIDEIKHPLIRNCIKYHARPHDKLSIVYVSDLPGNSGLGSSSAFCSAMISGLNKLKGGQELNKYQLSKDSIRMERDILGEAGGWQDQIATCYGGFNQICFQKNSFKVNPLSDNFISEYLQDCYLIHVGNLRKAYEVAISQLKAMKEKTALYEKMVALADPAIEAINNNDFNEFSRLIDFSWDLKKQYSSNITNTEVDDAVGTLKRIGGQGIKLLGAGSGGFLLCRFVNEPTINKLKDLGFSYFLKVKPTTTGVRSERWA